MSNNDYKGILFPETGESFSRVDGTHILDLYLGRDNLGRCTLLLLSDEEPPKAITAKVISVLSGKRKDGRWALSFSLVNEEFYDIFCHFCDDIVSSSRNLNSKREGAKFVCERYNQWQKMLKANPAGLLDKANIKGLLGELVFLKEVLSSQIGYDNAIIAWMGSEGADQDFTTEDTWYEVKAKSSGDEMVTISSIEQLDASEKGSLVVVRLDATSKSNQKGITLNSVTDHIKRNLDADSRCRFDNKLLTRGYVRLDEYDEYAYTLGKIEKYYVDDSFPCLRRNDVPKSVINTRYDLSLTAISQYEVKE